MVTGEKTKKFPPARLAFRVVLGMPMSRSLAGVRSGGGRILS
jgi:hypothetical protein